MKLPSVTGARAVRALERAGFAIVRVSGSHHRLVHADGRAATVPVHGSKPLREGTLRNVLKQAGLTPADFVDLL
jgi:predicted RNA binding protein YcfA (HicA-like mRNA interferase family)